ncbi:RcnB family protein [Sinorhizobium meliloti]|uniref:RcnB family protein n=1 Tax=Rhizobium meliloti TaxID=382 RepID=UPI003F15C160
MRKFVSLAMVALATLSLISEVAQAQNRTRSEEKIGQPSEPQQIKKRHWKKGGKFSGRGTSIADYQRHKLEAPPKGHRWVRDGDDFLLVAVDTGVIMSIVSGGGR